MSSYPRYKAIKVPCLFSSQVVLLFQQKQINTSYSLLKPIRFIPFNIYTTQNFWPLNSMCTSEVKTLPAKLLRIASSWTFVSASTLFAQYSPAVKEHLPVSTSLQGFLSVAHFFAMALKINGQFDLWYIYTCRLYILCFPKSKHCWDLPVSLSNFLLSDDKALCQCSRGRKLKSI